VHTPLLKIDGAGGENLADLVEALG